MKNSRLLVLTAFACMAMSGFAEEKGVVTTEESGNAPECCKKKQEPSVNDDDYKFRLGGYGEAVAAFKNYGINRFSGSNGSVRENRNTISIPRFVLAMDYKFSPKWILGAEIEFESGGVGTAMELEPSENNEYEREMEKGGEVALEQFHITRLILPAFNVRAGHLIIPVGLTNSHHEPINFFGTVRPESETTILPSTWHATGLEFFGSFSLGSRYSAFNYQASVTTGLNADGFGRDKWVAKGNQGIFEEDNFTSPGYAVRLDYVGLPGLRLGADFYYCADAAKNSDKTYKYSSIGKVPVRIYGLDTQYKNKYLTFRGNVLYGNMTNSAGVSSVSLSNLSSYYHGKMRQTAKAALAYGGELGVNLHTVARKLFQCDKFPVIYPFARYEYVNSQEKTEGSIVGDPRCQVSKWVGGINWYALPNLVVKADYSTRQLGTRKVFGTSSLSSENEFAIGIAYIGWFVSTKNRH